MEGGRPLRRHKLSQTQIAHQLGVSHAAPRGALASNFPTDRWTLERIQQLINRLFQIEYHPNYLSRLLARLDWTPQYPMPRAKARDDELVEAWLRRDWPRIKKSAAFES
ncbi:MAG: winged helix-turn-helix domain-containing protein [Chloroflexota bacterium]